MDLKSFFLALKDNGKTGGLFVAVFVGFILVGSFWQIAAAILGFGLLFWLCLSLGRFLAGRKQPKEKFKPKEMSRNEIIRARSKLVKAKN